MKSGHLSTEARQLIEAGRQGYESSELARARVRRAVATRLAGGAAALSLAHTSSLFAATKVVVALAVAGSVGAGVWYGLTRADGPNQIAVAPQTRSAAAAPAANPQTNVAPPALEQVAARPESSRGSTPPRVQRAAAPGPTARAVPVASARPAAQASQLTEEVALLARASAQLNQGNAAGAARTLSEYDRTFKSKTLVQERAATGVLVECAMGNVQGARSSARRFYKTWPRSPLASRIAGSCAGNADKP